MQCVSCGQDNPDGARFCVKCGKSFDPASVTTVSCPLCGKENLREATFCAFCGASLDTTSGRKKYEPSSTVDAKSRIAAGLLGIFLGGFGIHRFYLGYIGIGVVQIIVTLCTCGAGHIWGFIEGILVLVGSINKDAYGRPLRE